MNRAFVYPLHACIYVGLNVLAVSTGCFCYVLAMSMCYFCASCPHGCSKQSHFWPATDQPSSRKTEALTNALYSWLWTHHFPPHCLNRHQISSEHTSMGCLLFFSGCNLKLLFERLNDKPKADAVIVGGQQGLCRTTIKTMTGPLYARMMLQIISLKSKSVFKYKSWKEHSSIVCWKRPK